MSPAEPKALRAWIAVVALAGVSPSPAPNPRIPVVVELFTSEGCSSCPPAERVLSSVANEQSVPGAEVIVLSFHVDYWDRLGWIDAFGSPAFTDRQRTYAQRSNRVYTPQAIVDGQTDCVGSDEACVRSAITAAARSPKPILQIARAASSPDLVTLDVGVPSGAMDGADRVALAVIERGLRVDVKAGENKGERLDHTDVVRWFQVLPAGPVPRSFHAEVRPSPTWRRENLRAVAIVQSGATQAVRAVGVLPLPW